MLHKIFKQGNHLLVYCFYRAVFALVLFFICGNHNAYSQDLSDTDQQTAIMQYTLKYRFGKDLKVGDWAKYTAMSGANESIIELKVTSTEEGNLWIEEKTNGADIHYLINPQQMKLIKTTGTDGNGEKIDITPMSDEKLSGILEMFNTQIKQQGSFAQFVAWTKGTGSEDVITPAGSFSCFFLQPEFSEMYAGQIKTYEESLRAQGKSEEEIHKAIYDQVPRLYFNEDVPKLLPFNIAIGWMPWIEAFEGIEEGLVECRHMAPLKLTGYNK